MPSPPHVTFALVNADHMILTVVHDQMSDRRVVSTEDGCGSFGDERIPEANDTIRPSGHDGSMSLESYLS